MFGQAATYEGKRIARCVDAIYGESDQQRFVVGTCSPSTKKPNQLHLLDANLCLLRAYSHASPLQHFAMCPLPQRAHTILTTFTSERNEPTFAVWKLESVEDPIATSVDTPAQMTLASQTTMESAITKAIWNPHEDSSGAAIASLNATSIATWALAEGGAACKETSKVPLGEGKQLTGVTWDPHHRHNITATVDEAIQSWDLRSGKHAHAIEDAHLGCTRDVDYNPNKPYYIASGGDDGKVKFWDLRKPQTALLTLSGHSHWVWCVKYNRFHDQLVLSSSSDSLVNLWRVSSISSAPLLEMDDDDSEQGIDVGDARIKSYEEHEDSVYSVAWGSADSWLFASVSYSGRVVLNQVPSTEKYRILL
ncbi:hypothetical protein SDRG_03311 [Saprolegnia diclina VS20]|uniref:EIPR1-like beta-propeller domain-containing protein n=1 Tax=Saprolegnia diclina (strain VS20) TaxID=1156394 RepID=T0S2D4_SAPDV|nr:hypothetical protein SDRG_03311 [Saprolegnia diclina VS20]EQC39103.1 hypothetical protein SDRG_03311 [Saprolegnia diclina VS20]|eukprot:XP_008607164.1 hypothetical protein SDRG_03311 [Saprolegnia diclina VS20]